MSIQTTDKKYFDASRQRLSASSRLHMFNILKDIKTNDYILNIFRNITLISDVKENNIYFNIYYAEEYDWWDNISYKYYGTEKLWYLVCLMNNTVNPFEELEEGKQIKVLREGYLYNIYKALIDISRL